MRPRKTPGWLLLLGFAWLSLTVQPAYADPEKRIALLIGNSDYGDGKSAGGREDAAAIKDKLGLIGFTDANTVMVPDADLKRMNDELERFQDRMKDASVVVFFYSGHGFHRGRESYLLPVDSSPLPRRSLPLERVLQSLASAPKAVVKLVILNACRTEIDGGKDQNDLKKSEPGLAQPQGTPGKVVQAFATSPGLEANSGRGGKPSPYVKALLNHLFEPGLDLHQMFSAVREEVISDISTSNDLDPQFPVAYGLEYPEGGYTLSRPASIEARVELADDDLIVLLNGELALNHQTQEALPKEEFRKYLKLKSGENSLTVLVSNQKTLRHGLAWERTDGWGYALRLIGPDGRELTSPECGGQDPCFSGGEEVPFKDGPHHGKTFVVATATLFVDPSSGMSPRVSLREVKTDLWKNSEIPFWAKDQGLLYAISLIKLPLGIEVTGNIKEFFEKIVKVMLRIRVNIPDPDKIYSVVRGNVALKELVVYCLDSPQWHDTRMADFEKSLEEARDGKPTPFDGFVERLNECIRKRADGDPRFPVASNEIRVWTAFEDWTKEASQPGSSGSPAGGQP